MKLKITKEALKGDGDDGRDGVDSGELGKSWSDTFEASDAGSDDDGPDDDLVSTPGKGALSLPVYKGKKSTVSVEGAAGSFSPDEMDKPPAYVGVKYKRDF